MQNKVYVQRTQDKIKECGWQEVSNAVVAQRMNAKGYTTFHGNPWTKNRVHSFVHAYMRQETK